MEIIKIFIAVQTDNLKTDVSELESFFLRINNCYVSRGRYFTPILSESTSDDATGDTEIEDCALAFFLTTPGESALFSKGVPPSGGGGFPETYKTALNSYNKTGKPKLFVYTKTQCSVDSDQWSADEGNTAASTRSSVSNSTPRRNGAFHTQHSKLYGAHSSVSNSTLHTPHSSPPAHTRTSTP